MFKTAVMENEFKGNKLFTIAEMDDDNVPMIGRKFLVNIGIKKCKAILKHLKELEKFVDENTKRD